MSAPTCFGTGVSSTGSLLKQRTQVQHANPGTDRPHCHYQNIKIWKF